MKTTAKILCYGLLALVTAMTITSCQKDELIYAEVPENIKDINGRSHIPLVKKGPRYVLENSSHEMGGFANNAIVVFKDKIWSIGGDNAHSPRFFNGSDIWSSKNGKNWDFVKRNAFSGRSEHSILVYKNKLWVIGGVDSSGNILSDIWNSPNGVDWQRVNRFTPIGDIGNNSSVVFNNRIFIFISNGHANAKVWSSSDGVSWRLESSAAFPARNYTRTLVFNDYLYVVGGWDGATNTYSNDVWASHDGRSWRKNNPGPSTVLGAERIFSPRIEHTMTVFNGKVWLIGGLEEDNIFSSEVWTTANMKYWQKQEINPRIGPLSSHAVLTFSNKLWLFGGYRQAPDLSHQISSDIWSITE